MYIEVYGDLIDLALSGEFDVIAHGNNCFCNQAKGIAVPMNNHFGTLNFKMERLFDHYWDDETQEWSTVPSKNRGDINKLGQIDYQVKYVDINTKKVFSGVSYPIPSNVVQLTVVNAYTQYRYGHGLQLDYDALTLCLRKMNHEFKGKTIGLPTIGTGLAGGDWLKIKKIINKELVDCNVTVVIYEKD